MINCKPFLIDGEYIPPSTEARRVHIDSSLALDGHISSVIRSCYYQLRKIKEISRHLPTSTAALLVCATVVTRVDYCNSILWGQPGYQLSRLQIILNASARVIFGVRSGEYIYHFLKDKLHWLRIPERMAFKRCMLTFRALHDPYFPDYLVALVHRLPSTNRRLQLRSGRDVKLAVPPDRTVKFGERLFTQRNTIPLNALPVILQESRTRNIIICKETQNALLSDFVRIVKRS